MSNKRTTPMGFEVIRIVEVPEYFLHPEVKKALEGRETFTDVDPNINEKVYSGNVMEKIHEEQLAMEGSAFAMSIAGFQQVCELANDLRNYELFRVTTI